MRRLNHGDDQGEKVISLGNGGLISRVMYPMVGKAAGQCRMHIVVLIRRDPVILSDCVVGKVSRQLLQGRVVGSQGIGWRAVVTTIGAAEKDLGLCLAA